MDQPNEQQIEDFLFNRLPQTEAEQLKSKADSDEDFASLLAQRQLEVNAMALAEEDQIRAAMNDWTIGSGKEETTAASPLKVAHRRRPLTRVLSIAAGFLLLIFAGSTFFASANYSDTALADRYAQSRIAGSRGNNDANLLEPAKVLMAKGNFTDGLTALQELEGNAAAMLRGEALYRLNRFDESIQAYQQVAGSDSQLADEAAFQRALVLLAAGQTSAARTALEEVAANPANAFAKDAGQALNDLDGFWRNIAWW